MKIPKSIRTVVIACFLITMFAILMMMALGRNHNGFAQCLTQKGVVMYGTEHCPACIQQKELFGKSFKYVNYIDCNLRREECAEIQYTPTWEFSDGGQVVGYLELSQLSKMSGCKI